MEQKINGSVQKINDEDYEIIKVIESQSRVDAIKWYQENYNCNVEDAISTFSAIFKQYKGGYMPEASEIWLLFEKFAESEEADKAQDKVVKWLMSNLGMSEKDAFKKVMEACEYINSQPSTSNDGSKKGCMITILIAITSTLSLFCLF